MALKVCKFGGTSLATRDQIEKCIEIMLADKTRKFMVVSAPGSRFKGDIKITDLLIEAASQYKLNQNSEAADKTAARLKEILPEDPDLIEQLRKNLLARLSETNAPNYIESLKAFGEYACARIVDAILKLKGIRSEFIDPRDFGLVITGSGDHAKPAAGCWRQARRAIKARKDIEILVIPGFYGYDKEGRLQTLPRGGSDTSGAFIARSAGAAVYENWTDENGLKRADPRIVPNAATISEMVYEEARELAYMGFKLQDACFDPIRGHGIVLNVRNTNNPEHPGTRIMDSRDVDTEERIVGVARETGFVSIGMRKMYIDKEVGFGRKMLSVPEKLNLPYEHTPDGVDSAALVLAGKYLKDKTELDSVIAKLKKACKPETMIVREISLVSVAGIGMKDHYDVHSRTFSALAREKIAIRMIDEGADDLSFFIGVDNDRSEDAVRAIYNEFYPD